MTTHATRLALGTVQFGLPYGISNKTGQVSRSTAKAMLKQAAVSGIDTLDTAIAYGESESCLGEVGTQGFNLVTKLPAVPAGCLDVSGWVKEQVSSSLSRLGVNELHGLLLHRPMQLLEPEGATLYKALQGLKVAGQVRKIGISIYDPSELGALIRQHHFDLVQAPFNLVDRRLHTSGWLKRLQESGVEIHTRSAFLQGLLLMPPTTMPGKFLAWADLWEKWYGWLALHEITAVQACIAFALSFSEIDRIIVGADSVSQLEQIIDASTCDAVVDFPDLICNSEDLVNPARWNTL